MLLKLVFKQLCSVTDRQDDMLNTKVDQSMDLVQYHRLVTKFH